MDHSPQVAMLAHICTPCAAVLICTSRGPGPQSLAQMLRGFEFKKQTANLCRLHLAAPIATLPPSSTHTQVKVFYTQGAVEFQRHTAVPGALWKSPQTQLGAAVEALV